MIYAGTQAMPEAGMRVSCTPGHGGRRRVQHAGRLPDELGLSLARVGGTPLRLDVTYRLDEPGLFFGLGVQGVRFR